jgi:hypothetical protein
MPSNVGTRSVEVPAQMSVPLWLGSLLCSQKPASLLLHKGHTQLHRSTTNIV